MQKLYDTHTVTPYRSTGITADNVLVGSVRNDAIQQK